MNTDEFRDHVAQRSPVETDEQARDAVEATLTAIGESISGASKRGLAESLPDELRDVLESTDNVSEEDYREQFIERIKELERTPGVTSEEAREHFDAVMSALTEAVPSGRLENAVDELPENAVAELDTDLGVDA